MDSYTAITIGVLSVIASVISILIVYKIIRYVRKRNEPKTPKVVKERQTAHSMSGNLVKDLENVLITRDYELSKIVLGRGSSAEVVVGTHHFTRRKYAIKVIDTSKRDIAWRYDREKSILKDVDHTNIVRLFEVYRNANAQYFVLELCSGGHLGQVLKDKPDGRLDEGIAKTYIMQICQAIAHCHNHGICHRDIKLQNILLESNNRIAQVKIIDFGNR